MTKVDGYIAQVGGWSPVLAAISPGYTNLTCRPRRQTVRIPRPRQTELELVRDSILGKRSWSSGATQQAN